MKKTIAMVLVMAMIMVIAIIPVSAKVSYDEAQEYCLLSVMNVRKDESSTIVLKRGNNVITNNAKVAENCFPELNVAEYIPNISSLRNRAVSRYGEYGETLWDFYFSTELAQGIRHLNKRPR